jgi:hypothetical protein
MTKSECKGEAILRITRIMHQEFPQSSHTQGSFSAKTWPFELSKNFLNIELHQLQYIEKWQEFMQLLAGIQKFT